MTASSMMPLYREWQAALATCDGRMTDEERDEMVTTLLDPIEDRLLETPVVTTGDLLIRLRVKLHYVLQPAAGHDDLLALIDEHMARAS